MKKVLRISPIILAAIIIFLAAGCKKEEPETLTQPASNISNTGATLYGIINPNGLSAKVAFEYGTTTSYGNTVAANGSPVTGNSIAYVSADISGLTPCTEYHFRVKVENSHWTSYGSDLTINTGIPTLTITVSAVTATTAISEVNIVYECPYPPITDRGVELYRIFPRYGLLTKKTHDGTGPGSFTSALTGLPPSNRYYVQAYATSRSGTTYGNRIYFTTPGIGK